MDNPNIGRDLKCYEDAIKICAEKQPWQTVEFDADFVRESFEELVQLRKAAHEVNFTYDMYKSLQSERDKLRAENVSLQNQLKRMRDMFNESSENEEIRLRAENARLREQNDIAVHFVRWVIQWESDPDVKALARYMIDNAKLTLKEINKSTPPSQAENVSKNSGEIDK